eukprot:SAG31_NODE_3510_length_4179_cov_6.712500_2_plen_332_part_00
MRLHRNLASFETEATLPQDSEHRLDRWRARASHLYAAKSYREALDELNGALAQVDRVLVEGSGTGGEIRKNLLDMAARCHAKLGDHEAAAQHIHTLEQVSRPCSYAVSTGLSRALGMSCFDLLFVQVWPKLLKDDVGFHLLKANVLSHHLCASHAVARSAEHSLMHTILLRPTHRMAWHQATEHYARLVAAAENLSKSEIEAHAAEHQAADTAKWRLCAAAAARVSAAAARNAGSPRCTGNQPMAESDEGLGGNCAAQERVAQEQVNLQTCAKAEVDAPEAEPSLLEIVEACGGDGFAWATWYRHVGHAARRAIVAAEAYGNTIGSDALTL